MKFYFIGIKGSGMSSLASLLKQDGNEVIGKDVEKYIYTQKELQKKGIPVLSLEDRSYLNGNYYVVVGHDFYKEELVNELKNHNIDFSEYNEFISNYLKNNLIRITGTNGKTTLTGMLAKGSKNASFLRGDGVSFRAKKEKYFFLEACEYKEHFLKYKPNFAIITNITYDHVDYFKTKEEYDSAFIKFASKADKVLVNYQYKDIIDNENTYTYGLDKRADFYAKDYETTPFGIKGVVYYKGLKLIDFNFKNIFGEHLIEDVVATFAYYYLQQEDLQIVKRNLESFSMPNKRFNITNLKNIAIINDYAHQPEQINADFKTINKMYKNYIKVALFRPDRISRIKYFYNDFINSLNQFDEVYLVDDEKNTFKVILESMCDKKIKMYNRQNFKIYKNKKCVYCFMSSKNMDFIIKDLKKAIS